MGEEPDPLAQAFATLSAREREVVRLVADGLSNADIADVLALSPRTVQSHVAAALRKTASSSRTQLAVRAIRYGVASLDGD